MLEAGVASAADIDRAMELGYRHPMGPLKLTDLVGLDVRLAILEHLHREVGEQFRPPTILRQMVRAGRLGKKTGEGFYRWTETGPEPSSDERPRPVRRRAATRRAPRPKRKRQRPGASGSEPGRRYLLSLSFFALSRASFSFSAMRCAMRSFTLP